VSSIVTQQGILHYESIGRGQPVILLHGWINSWDVWRDSMIALASSGHYRVYALDFWGFGASAKETPNNVFKIDSYVQMVYQFMETLGIRQAPVFGHSMGGTVALKLALLHPERVTKVAAIGAPVVGRSLNPMLKFAGFRWIADLVGRKPDLLQPLMSTIILASIRILLAGDNPRVQAMIRRDVQRTTVDSFVRSIGDLRLTDLRQQLPSLHMPTLGVYGSNDNIVLPNSNVRLLTSLVPASAVKIMTRSRHFPMTDEPEKFLDTLYLFLSTGHEQPHGRQRVNGAAPV
jgi:pimeloyl-ACP methyl ester carboxylesterase